MPHLFNNTFDRAFSSTAVFVGYVFMALGVFSLFNNVIIGVVLLVASSVVCFSVAGIQIDVANQKYKEYVSLFGLKAEV